MRFAIENPNKETAYRFVGSFRICILSSKTPKNTCLAMENRNTETAYNCRQFPYFNFKWKTPKNMRFAMEDTNTETAYNCRQFPYFNFMLKNAKKQAFCNGKPEYGNCLQL